MLGNVVFKLNRNLVSKITGPYQVRLFHKVLNFICSLIVITCIYFVGNFLLVSDGFSDPIYEATGLARKQQISILGLLFLPFVVCQIIRLLSAVEKGLNIWSKHQKIQLKLPYIGTDRTTWDWVIVFLLIQLCCITSSLGAFIKDDHVNLTVLYGWVSLIMSIEALLLLYSFRVMRSFIVNLLLLIIFSALNVYALNLSLASWFQSLSIATHPTVTLALLILSVSLTFSWLNNNSVNLRVLIVTLLAMAISPAFLILFDKAEDEEIEMAAYGSVRLADTPDIHIVSMESLASPHFLENELDIDVTPIWQSLSRPGVEIFETAFSSSAPTIASLNSVMRLANPSAKSQRYFSGRSPSPLGALLKANGYYLKTGYSSMFLGKKGPHVDFYHPETHLSFEHSTLCSLAEGAVLTFFGFCSLSNLMPNQWEKKYDARVWETKVLNGLKKDLASTKARPIFSFQQLPGPMIHTSVKKFRYSKENLDRFKNELLPKINEAATLISKLHGIAELSQSDRKFILIVMGDHGVLTSRGMPPTKTNEKYRVQDRFGIVLTVLFNNTQCRGEKITRFIEQYATPERLLGGIFHCLESEKKQIHRLLGSFQEGADYASHPFN